MSGGVDSSLAAKLMIDSGFDCIGCTMKLYHNQDIGIENTRSCCSLNDTEDARSVCYKLGMPYYVFNTNDDNGFVIVSGDDRTAEILAYSDNGRFNADEIPDNMR